jgi:hypothetical protein
MKSIIQEASSLSKAIEQGWQKAGKPIMFSVKILQDASKNFIGLTTQNAKIAIYFGRFDELQAQPTNTAQSQGQRSSTTQPGSNQQRSGYQQQGNRQGQPQQRRYYRRPQRPQSARPQQSSQTPQGNSSQQQQSVAPQPTIQPKDKP